jgi:3-methylfumaryl-CoA hydratase
MSQRFNAWIGKQATETDWVTAMPLRRLAAMLDHDIPPWHAHELPPLGHWLFHLPDARQSELGTDGHPHRGGFMPPIPLPRRMWAGSRIRFLRSVAIGAQILRRSTVMNLATRTVASGQMVRVTIRHDIVCNGETAIEEEQDIVYVDDQASNPRQRTAVAMPEAQISRRFQATPELLFRFSALTFNAHRIHYDRDYARDAEHYPGLVVHGPLLAMLLVDHFLRHRPGSCVTGFSVRARAPTFERDTFELCLATQSAGVDLWISGTDGAVKMTAQIEAR